MKQIYYVIQTLLRTRFKYHQGHFFGIGIDDEYLLSPAWHMNRVLTLALRIMITCIRYGRYSR